MLSEIDYARSLKQKEDLFRVNGTFRGTKAWAHKGLPNRLPGCAVRDEEGRPGGVRKFRAHIWRKRVSRGGGGTLKVGKKRDKTSMEKTFCPREILRRKKREKPLRENNAGK